MSSGGSEPGDAISVRSGDSAVAPDLNSRELMSAHCYSAGNKPRFVCKTVNKGLLDENKLTYLKGVVDLALEAKYLTALSHPHILEIRGMSSHGMFDSHGPFLILDRLAETLPKRLKDWMTRDRANKGVTGIFVGGKKKSQSLLVERLRVAFDMASALSYLHGRRVIYRDIKPDNMGFDQRNRVKIFDFGLAKQLHDDERTKDGLYKMTGFTGSIRYMAPEASIVWRLMVVIGYLMLTFCLFCCTGRAKRALQ
jgi:serine/threonine protein kinase